LHQNHSHSPYYVSPRFLSLLKQCFRNKQYFTVASDTGCRRSAMPFLTCLLDASLGQLCWRGEEMRHRVRLWFTAEGQTRTLLHRFDCKRDTPKFFFCPDNLLSRIVRELSHISNAGYESGPTDIYRSSDTGFTVC
jgi:hypothetical protein